jgi:hypothetical protein
MQQKYSCMALANMSLSSFEHLGIFCSAGVLRQCVVLVYSDVTNVQEAVGQLLCNLSYHRPLVPIMLENEVLGAVKRLESSIMPEVRRKAEITTSNFLRNTARRTTRRRGGSVCMRDEYMGADAFSMGIEGGRFTSDMVLQHRHVKPLVHYTTWDEWGSQLDRLGFLQEKTPQICDLYFETFVDEPLEIHFAKAIGEQMDQEDDNEHWNSGPSKRGGMLGGVYMQKGRTRCGKMWEDLCFNLPCWCGVKTIKLEGGVDDSEKKKKKKKKKSTKKKTKGTRIDDRFKHDIIEEPKNGSINEIKITHREILIYKPVNGFVGEDTFRFNLSNGVIRSNVATCKIRVSAKNWPPKQLLETEELHRALFDCNSA